ncbi:hypothetical protein [Thermotalea metallivorans]|uniref:Uncharacterized protein n=1 Tax=Thermotalea metallivorans TaxID=520762 RepID=A0A140L787_9FIRM|nr:hypothetical protein [Thermotalea metallivorans]KXG76412.1 hypothetical protein AN619_09430 [Thermotalea metallivorans]
MDKANLLKMMYAHEQVGNQSSEPYPSLEDMIKGDKKLKKLVSQLLDEQLVQYQNSKLVLTNMGKYLAKIL